MPNSGMLPTAPSGTPVLTPRSQASSGANSGYPQGSSAPGAPVYGGSGLAPVQSTPASSQPPPVAPGASATQKANAEAQVQQLLQLLTQVQQQSRAASAGNSGGVQGVGVGSAAALHPSMIALVPQISQLVQQTLQQPQVQQQYSMQHFQPQTHMHMPQTSQQPMGFGTPGLAMGLPGMPPGLPMGLMMPPPPPPVPPLPPVPPMNGGGGSCAGFMRKPLPPQQETLLSEVPMSEQQRKFIENKSANSSGRYDPTQMSSEISDRQDFYDNRKYHDRNGTTTGGVALKREILDRDWDNGSGNYKRQRDQDSGESRQNPSYSGNGNGPGTNARREGSVVSERHSRWENEDGASRGYDNHSFYRREDDRESRDDDGYN
ncbi:hypothetical protein BGZ75_008415, partial [Mortierella antarctica]